MQRFWFAALAAGVMSASCTGHYGGAGALPPVGSAAGSNTALAAGPAVLGTRTTRRLKPRAIPAGWAATATGALPLANAADLGALAASSPVTVHVGLQLRDVKGLEQIVAGRGTVPNGAFMSTYAPTSASAAAVASYLQSKGFTHVTTEPNRILIDADGTAAQVEKAFDTTLHAFTVGGARVYANTTPAYVPQSLSGIVVAVLGLNDAQAMTVRSHHGPPSPRPSPTPPGTPASPCSLYGLEIVGFPSPEPEPVSTAGCLRNYRPADYWRAYDVGNTKPASSVNVAIMTAGQLANAISDLRVNEQADNIPQVPVYVKQVGVPGGPITDGPDEWTLDMTASSGMAQSLHALYVYNAPSLNDADVVLMYNHWVTDDLAKIGNSSFGGCEAFEFLDGAMLVADEIFLQGASQGQTMFASAGDTGSFCPVAAGANGVPAGAPLVNWPAASSYTTSVGGTTLVTMTDGSYQGETAWYSTGGGLSQFEYAPSWEAQAQPVASNGESYRGVPDIAMDGDLQTGMILYTTDFGWSVIGGTSLASPLAAGVWARMLQAHGTSLGYAPPRLYNVYATHAAGALQTGPPPWEPRGGFHDILAGANGLYTAAPGYDYTTGLGSFDVQATSAIVAQ
jgi:pseudomonalisin